MVTGNIIKTQNRIFNLAYGKRYLACNNAKIGNLYTNKHGKYPIMSSNDDPANVAYKCDNVCFESTEEITRRIEMIVAKNYEVPIDR